MPASDAEWSASSDAPMITSAAASMVPDGMIGAMRARKPRGSELARLRAEFSFMQSPSGKFPARRSVRLRAGARYSTPHGNPQSRRKASVPDRECGNWLRRERADGLEYEQCVSVIPRQG